VPNNGSGDSFAATIANVFLALDLNVMVNRLTFKRGDGNPIILGGTAPFLFALTTISPPHTRRSGTAALLTPTRKPRM
jgi:hypothetical protein